MLYTGPKTPVPGLHTATELKGESQHPPQSGASWAAPPGHCRMPSKETAHSTIHRDSAVCEN
ncbi:rCG58144 [Rattus norvegicus]|uniref:RCG58144 n=1 Tax=Rattus norvegicus TaxID=10116 RepID=A6J562_RAT|nr:rCG58144 [Rattus norvegicus]